MPTSPPTPRAALALAVGLALASLLAACGDSDSGAGEVTAGQIASLELSHRGAPVAFNAPFILSTGGDGEGADEVLTIRNTGNGDLELDAITITSVPAGVLTLATADGAPLPADIVVPASSATGYAFHLVYTPPASPGGVIPTGVITFRSNAVRDGVSAPTITLDVTVDDPRPHLQVLPTTLDFGPVRQGEVATKQLSLLNAGNTSLVVDGLALGGHPGFEVTLGAETFTASAGTAATVDLATPLTIAPGQTETVAVTYAPTGPEPATAQLTLFSNDPAAAAGTVVPLKANTGGPCIALTPRKLEFGGRQVGRTVSETVTVTSCGDEPLVLSEIAMAEGGSSAFAVRPPQSLTIAAGEAVTFAVDFTPAAVAAVDASGTPVLEAAQVSVRSNAFVGDTRLDVSGYGANPSCPVAVITKGAGEDEVVPQSTVHLSGADSYSSAGAITRWSWDVSQPVGSQSVFKPGADATAPTFEANVAGEYEFRLRVWDATGAESCVAAKTTVTVTPSQALHIELLWRTPSDPDETTAPGTDLDLHFAHPSADSGHDGDGDGVNDPWFDLAKDAFWFKKHPDWGVAGDTADDPSLDRDDKDGAGPENVNFNGPEGGLVYAIGVHYWANNEFQTAFATVRVYVYGQKVFEVPDVELAYDDLWTVGTVAWPSGAVSLARVCDGTFTACTNDAGCSGVSCVLRVAHHYDNVAVPN